MGIIHLMIYYGMRYYNPRLGRWISRDPAEEIFGVHLYGFIDQDAINYFDINGEMKFAGSFWNWFWKGMPSRIGWNLGKWLSKLLDNAFDYRPGWEDQRLTPFCLEGKKACDINIKRNEEYVITTAHIPVIIKRKYTHWVDRSIRGTKACCNKCPPLGFWSEKKGADFDLGGGKMSELSTCRSWWCRFVKYKANRYIRFQIKEVVRGIAPTKAPYCCEDYTSN